MSKYLLQDCKHHTMQAFRVKGASLPQPSDDQKTKGLSWQQAAWANLGRCPGLYHSMGRDFWVFSRYSSSVRKGMPTFSDWSFYIPHDVPFCIQELNTNLSDLQHGKAKSVQRPTLLHSLGAATICRPAWGRVESDDSLVHETPCDLSP